MPKFSHDQVRIVEQLAAELAVQAPDGLREDAYCELRLHGLLAVARAGEEKVSRERLRQLLSKWMSRWLAAQRRPPVLLPAPPPSESGDWLRAAILRLPSAYAAVAWRRIVDGASLEVVAEELGIAQPFAQFLLQRALDMLVGDSDMRPPDVAVLSEQLFEMEMRQELVRAKRRGYSVSLFLLVGPRTAHVQARAVDAVIRGVRAYDLVGWLQGDISVGMPHADKTAAPGIALRLQAISEKATALPWQAGWAAFPEDGRTLPELSKAARARAEAVIQAADNAAGRNAA
ncbi:MAG: hypothetical protein H5T86_07195 [Armatimonadetes bacterium]|nr:hypothetical protein [Armatimonadota bacterium]